MTRPRAIAGALLVLVAIAVYVLRMTGELRDFEVYWAGSAHAAAGEPLYRAEDGHYVYKYFPAFAVLAIPLGVLPLPLAKGIWFAGSVVLLVLLVISSQRLLTTQQKTTAFLTAAVIVVLGKFIARELVLGQANLLFAVLAVSAVLAMNAQREWLAGVLIALTIAVKPYGVLFLPWLVARRQRESIAAAGIALTAIVLLPLPLYGIEGTIALYRDWWTTVTASTASSLTGLDSVSFGSLYAKWLSPGPLAATMAIVTGIAALALAVAVFVRRSAVAFPEALEASMLLMLIPLLSPQGWDYVLLLAAPAVVLLANHLAQLPAGWKTAAIAASLTMGLSMFDLMGRRLYGAFMQLAPITICASVLLAALYYMRVRRIA